MFISFDEILCQGYVDKFLSRSSMVLQLGSFLEICQQTVKLNVTFVFTMYFVVLLCLLIAFGEGVVVCISAHFRLEGDLDIYSKTASKYDDCRLLHFPKLTLS